MAINSAVDGPPSLTTFGGEGSDVPVEGSQDLTTGCENLASSLKHNGDDPVGQVNVVVSTAIVDPSLQINGAGEQACQTTNSEGLGHGDPKI